MENDTSSSRQILPEDLPVYDGLMLPAFPELTQDVEKKMDDIRNLESRQSDLLICAYIKSGTHWVSEIVEQLVAGKAEYSDKPKGDLFLEARDFVEHGLQDIPSPRNLNTHLPYRMLPWKHIKLNAKIIHILRNPKDVAVSAFHHAQKDVELGHSEIDSWCEFINVYPTQFVYGTWFEYEKQWEQAKRENPYLNILTLYYEDLKLHTTREITRIAEFLEVNYTEELISEIAKKVDFKNFFKGKPDVTGKSSKDGKPFIYRKGMIGDWKNWFTVAQNERFEAVYCEQMKDSNLRFIYSP